MEVEAFRKIHPAEFHRKFLVHNLRPDGRSLFAVRETSVTEGSIGTTFGSAFVKMGSTSVIAGVRAEVGTFPKATRVTTFDKQEPFSPIIVNVELRPLCSPKFKPGKPSEQQQQLVQTLNTLLRTTNIIDPKELCVKEGEVSWYLYVDMYCLDYDGALFDACLLALLAALERVRLPKAMINEAEDGSVTVTVTPEREQTLRIHNYPVSLTFGTLDSYEIADPTAAEEEILDNTFSIVYNNRHQLCGVYKFGGSATPHDRLKQCMERARARVEEVMALLTGPSSS
ncbi:Ribosomal RNA-processing protein 43 [Balamuthia mandrillaris]